MSTLSVLNNSEFKNLTEEWSKLRVEFKPNNLNIYVKCGEETIYINNFINGLKLVKQLNSLIKDSGLEYKIGYKLSV